MTLKDKLLQRARETDSKRKSADSEPKVKETLTPPVNQSVPGIKSDPVEAPIKPQSVPGIPLSVPGINSPDLIKTPRRDLENAGTPRQERTLSHPETVPAFPQLGRPKSALEPYQSVERDRHGKFKPGSSGNPKGPTMGFVEYIRLMTGDGHEMVDHAVECLRGWVRVQWQESEDGHVYERKMPADPKYQAEARAWLTDRGYGKAIQVIETNTAAEPVENLQAFTTEQLRSWLELNAILEGRALLGSGVEPAQEAEGRESEEDAEYTPVTPALPQGGGPQGGG